MYISKDLTQWQAFISLLEQAVKQGKTQEILMLLMTPDERDTIGLRLQIVLELLNGTLPQREIQQKLHTSAATITRGSNMMKTMSPELLEWVKNTLDMQKPTQE